MSYRLREGSNSGLISSYKPAEIDVCYEAVLAQHLQRFTRHSLNVLLTSFHMTKLENCISSLSTVASPKSTGATEFILINIVSETRKRHHVHQKSHPLDAGKLPQTLLCPP